ncbi:FCS-Like Zinc finger 1 [Lycium ferocissimum]|uniref:FCS-Like Zinc finger 1 n=1 Tax=Lycium ferocissimum TaxID=112874 RepID=UPI0028158258|nr:FCS-Like Zinc finger 1 [Lycium ferocissimum]
MDSTSSTRRRRTCFIEEDYGLVSLAETQPGFSGNNNNNQNNHNNNKNMISRPLYYTVSSRRKNSLRNLSSFSSASCSSSSCSSISSPRSVVTAAGKYYNNRVEEPQQHFLDACYLCKKRIGDNCDIFMYRGDTPFCSEECRQQQIEKDEAKEKKRNISSIKAMRKKEQRQSTSPSKTTDDYPFRPGTVAAA